MKLDDKVSMALSNLLHTNKYFDDESYTCIFMAKLLFSILSPFWKIEGISAFETILCAYMYLNQYYADYYIVWRICIGAVHYVDDRGESKILRQFC